MIPLPSLYVAKAQPTASVTWPSRWVSQAACLWDSSAPESRATWLTRWDSRSRPMT